MNQGQRRIALVSLFIAGLIPVVIFVVLAVDEWSESYPDIADLLEPLLILGIPATLLIGAAFYARAGGRQ